jgi:hypothetical protein
MSVGNSLIVGDGAVPGTVICHRPLDAYPDPHRVTASGCGQHLVR